MTILRVLLTLCGFLSGVLFYMWLEEWTANRKLLADNDKALSLLRTLNERLYSTSASNCDLQRELRHRTEYCKLLTADEWGVVICNLPFGEGKTRPPCLWTGSPPAARSSQRFYLN